MTGAIWGYFGFSFCAMERKEDSSSIFFLQSLTSKHHSFVCLFQRVLQVTAPPSDKPLSIFKAPVRLTDQPRGPSNFTAHLWGHREALPPAKSVYVTESVERKSIPSHLDRLNPNFITPLFCPQQSFRLCSICMILHNNTASRVR